MAFTTIHFSSNLLEKQVAMNVILPDRGNGPFATFYLLHGLSDDYTVWHRRTRIEWYVRDLPLIVVMPDGFRGYYTDNAEGPPYARFFGEELPAFVERIFPAKKSRAGRCIGGLSMGGYGAMRIGLGFPDMFASITSHSGAMMAGSQAPKGPNAREFVRIFGRNPAGSDHDLRVLIRRCAKVKKLPKLRFDCGEDDFLIDMNRAFDRFLNQQRIAHEYEEFPGEHTWDYWDTHIQEALQFHARALKL